MKAIYAETVINGIKAKFCKDCPRKGVPSECESCKTNEILKLIDNMPDPEKEDASFFFKICFNCGQRSVGWRYDYSFEDYGIEGDGVVHVLECKNCGADIEYYCPCDPPEDEEKEKE